MTSYCVVIAVVIICNYDTVSYTSTVNVNLYSDIIGGVLFPQFELRDVDTEINVDANSYFPFFFLA